ncbi:uncharacterized protein LOC107817595 [Nicotiana tabacum]|uniref:Uncharacterized protein LOC107817595 n=2 Tax=Nicotiana TaxID=4085 RepID=A0A1S4CCI7_TOBAC|nr:PREDICTED: uncharacterized protein LOC104244468 [Nicotiana sylvestris]XP_016498932.1 PREDICTED: uncharacterized protein LOC107817595 [Nicotiana tabacum]
MSETTETSPAIITTGDLQNVQAAYRLNGQNFLKWSQFVRTFLRGKGKLSHLLGTGPSKEDPKFEAWDEQDSMVMSWLWNSMIPEISDTVMFLSTAKEIWEAIQQTYSKVNDAARIYELKTKVTSMKQGARSVTEYANLLQGLWQEIDHYQCIQMRCPEDAVTLKRFIEREHTYDFLAGLNVELDRVRVQVLGKEELPSLNEAVSIVRAEEGRRSVMLDTQAGEGSALVAKGAGQKENGMLQSSDNSTKPTNASKPINRDSLYCTYCKKHRHTRERCWKLNGKPQNNNHTGETGLCC